MELRTFKIFSTCFAKNLTDTRDTGRASTEDCNDTGRDKRGGKNTTGNASTHYCCCASKNCPNAAAAPGANCSAEGVAGIEDVADELV